MQDILFYIGSFIVALGILVAVHEFGHFWVARKLGVKVVRFSIGFGRPLLRRISPRDGTEYVLAAVPLGGYVKMLDEREGTVPEQELHLTFNRQVLWKRTAIVAAGPAFNFLFAILVFWGILVVGEEGLRPLVGEVADGSIAEDAGFLTGDELLAVDDRPTPTWQTAGFSLMAQALDGKDIVVRVRDAGGQEQVRLLVGDTLAALSPERSILSQLGLAPARPDLPARLGELNKGWPAAQSGLRSGDLILAIDDQRIDLWSELVELVQSHPGRPLRFHIERPPGEDSRSDPAGRIDQGGGQRFDLTVIPRVDRVGDREVGRIGAAPQEAEHLYDDYRVLVRLGPIEAVGAAVGKTADISLLLVRMVGRIIVGESSVENLSGPLSIAEMAGKSARYGLDSFVRFLALVSISLAVINLFPIPILDGGHLLYFAIEAVKGSPLSEQAQLWGQHIGLVLLAALMTLAFYVDISRWLG